MAKLVPVSVKKWRKFLKNEGLHYVRTSSSHEIWNADPELRRPVTFRNTDKDIPVFIIGKCLETMGISRDEFLEKISRC